MANANAPSGLAPVAYLNGAPWTGQARMYRIRQADTNAYAIGDPVKTDAGNADAAGVSAVTLAVAGDTNVIRGVLVGTMGNKYGGPGVDPASPQTTVIPAAKLHDYYVLVVDDPMVVFEIQQLGGTMTTGAPAGKNANLHSGTNNGYVSGWTLDDSASATTATNQLRLLGLVQRADNAPGAYAKWLVTINNHEFHTGVAGV